jgi:hypothetical protein
MDIYGCCEFHHACEVRYTFTKIKLSPGKGKKLKRTYSTKEFQINSCEDSIMTNAKFLKHKGCNKWTFNYFS